MSKTKPLKMNIKDKISSVFQVETREQAANRLHVTADKNLVSSILLYLKTQLGYIHLNHISCVDWIEKNQFELVYIVWNPQTKKTVLVHTFIDREQPEMENIDTIWDQAHTYEREMREMYGIEFPGLVAPKEFILEDWSGMPPMRRDFDTKKYAQETYSTRPGRENARDVREELMKRSGEELPDFAKKYSRD
ncbi:MAG TPA: NADH-quinone oxidoreductase subunit C [Flavobacteriales bacterium]|jgi:NADH-quinone oxidoreductase subunit C|nr:NADH-quinone oxidoreductase subunit C [Flavobacteriales bacterium]